jgi:hypothetical protein
MRRTASQTFAATATLPDGPLVQLRYATLPSLCRAIAVHHWFTAFDPETRQWQRWEVWQNRNAGGKSWGHVHCDLMHPDRGVGGGPCVVAAEWRGETARALHGVLLDHARYPHREQYRVWPGPNSNTYVAWVLREAGVPCDLDPRAIGKDYLGLGGAGRITATGFQVETPLLGVKLGRAEGAELHLLGFTLGVQTSPPALKTPLGRLKLCLFPGQS